MPVQLACYSSEPIVERKSRRTGGGMFESDLVPPLQDGAFDQQIKALTVKDRMENAGRTLDDIALPMQQHIHVAEI